MQEALAGREGVALVGILPAEPADVRRFRDALGLGAILLADPSWSTHRAYGFGRGGARDVWLSPATWWSYARLVARGRRLRLPRQDVYELGGDALVDRDGVLAWIHRSRHPADRPPIREILRVVGEIC